jgi:hypothetical protein
MFPQSAVRRAMLILAAIALFVALVPGISGTVEAVDGPAALEFRNNHPEIKPGKTIFTLGWTASPLFEFHKETRIVEQGAGLTWNSASGWQLRFFSWSTAALVIGVALLSLARNPTTASAKCPLPKSPSNDATQALPSER